MEPWRLVGFQEPNVVELLRGLKRKDITSGK